MSANLSVEQSLMKAKSYSKKGDLAEAQKLYETILQNFSNNIRAQQGLASLKKYNATQSLPQEEVDQLVNLYNRGHITSVIKQCEVLVKQYAGEAVVWNILGASSHKMGIFDRAIEAYKRVILLNPENADTFNNIGVAFKQQGKFDEAIESYKKSLSLKPDNAGVYYNLGFALRDNGKFNEAIQAYKKSISLKPDYIDSYNNMGNILQDQGKFEKAIEVFIIALSLNPDYAEGYFNIGSSLKGITFNKTNPCLQKIITSLLDKKTYVRPNDISNAAMSLLKLEPKLYKYLVSQNIDDEGLKILEVVKNLSNLPLLLKLMSVCPITDIELERLLRRIRASLLSEISYLSNSTELLKFQSALALQCFTNEYIYNHSEYEDKALEDLDELVKLTINNNQQPKAQFILCLASYKPLNHYEWSNSLLVTNEIKNIFTRQVIEPNKETNLKKFIPLLENVTDKVSSKVQEQYELSPYPRWVNLRLHLKPVSISKVISEMKLKIFDNKIKNVKMPDILVAGCGTGQHSIETAAKFKDSKVLAVDLSTSSLSYAKRKTEELSIKNIDYMQADILDLGKLGKQFDIVESVGVLHHMADPVAGWRILTNCLKPGGLMKIGLYSELARQDIIKLREEILETGIGSKDYEMKSFRNMLIKSDKNHHRLILKSSDFYTMSTLKDLLFHVQEHRFTIAQIQECLADLGLKFCGFETDTIVADYKLTNSSEDDPYNLDKWHTYEVKYPETFSGMYQFWCQKLA
jgi:tetratricopeptide (TPR) repeat protein